MARPSFLYITVEYDTEHKQYFARLPFTAPMGAGGALGETKECAVRNLYAVMDATVILCEETLDGAITVWARPTIDPSVTVVSL